MPQENNIFFTTPDKPKWLKLIVDSYQRYNFQGNGIQVFISFGTDIAVKDLMPMHLVTLACLIQFLSDHNWQANLSPNNPSVDDYKKQLDQLTYETIVDAIIRYHEDRLR